MSKTKLISIPLNDITSNFLNMKSPEKKTKKFLNHKRKTDIHSDNFLLLKNKKNKKLNNANIKIELTSSNNQLFKFQNFSKNNLSIIFSFLKLDDIMKLKSIGCRNVYNYIKEILDLKKENGLLTLKKIKTNDVSLYISDNDSTFYKKYFLENEVGNYTDLLKQLKIKCIIYHKPNKKIYYLIKNVFNYYFCACDEKKDTYCLNAWENDILFKIKELKYIEKFQFIEQKPNSKVAFFSLNNILLYNLSNEDHKYNIINLDHNCDYVLYKQNLELLVVPFISYHDINFYSINNYSPKKISKPKFQIIKETKDQKCDLNEVHDMKNFDNLICFFCSCSKIINIFDCKKGKIIFYIIFNTEIKNIEISNKHIIAFTCDNYANVIEIKNDTTFVLKFKFRTRDFEHISLFHPTFSENIFFVIQKNKTLLMYLEYDDEKNKLYFSDISFNNEFNEDELKNINFIVTSTENDKINDNECYKFKVKVLYKEYDNNKRNKIDYIVKDYSMII